MRLVRSSALFTFGYPNLMPIIATIYQLLLQYKHSYIRWLSNCGICIRCAAYFYIHKAKQPELTPSGRLVIHIFDISNQQTAMYIYRQINGTKQITVGKLFNDNNSSRGMRPLLQAFRYILSPSTKTWSMIVESHLSTEIACAVNSAHERALLSSRIATETFMALINTSP